MTAPSSIGAAILSGPTCEDQPVFDWDAAFPGVPHVGQPAVWNFPVLEVAFDV